jgi:putative membrane protein
MRLVATSLSALVALIHLWFLVLEMFLWTRPLGLKTFGQSEAEAQATRVLAANQGLYNGFLAAGLVFALARGDLATRSFFLGCVIVAGLYGGMTAKRSILVVQALPGAIALALSWVAY